MEKEELLLITRQELAKIGITYSNTHLLSLEKIGAFPQRMRLSPQKVVWNYAEVMGWLNERSSQRGRLQ
jgi:predicted DNA-binding transcriptional regulator AlpA